MGALKVAYVGGWGRSGSTLLDRMLGQVSGCVSLGEVRQIWQRGCLENASCGCGTSFKNCDFWTEVGEVAFGGWGNLDVRRAVQLRLSLDRGWSVAFLIAPRALPAFDRQLAEYGVLLARLYRGIQRVARADVIVDSSKLPSHAFILRRLPELDLRLIHLVRDSRGVAFSWQKQLVKDPITGDKLLTYGPKAAALRYNLYNLQTRLLRSMGVPYLFARYEDLVANPEPTLRRIFDHIGSETQPDLSFLSDEAVDLRPNHTVGGNPMRFRQGPITLRPDDRWKEGLSRSDRRWVTSLTYPLLLRYGYTGRWRRGAEPAAEATPATLSGATRGSQG